MTSKVYNNSHLTAKERTSLSFPVRWLLQNNYLKGRILDFGCGLGSDVKILSLKGRDISRFDKYYFPEIPSGKFDTIICSYVLNVLQPDEQPDVFMNVCEFLNPSGKAYYAVRRDIRFEGFRIHKIHKTTTYQCIVYLPFKSIFINDFCEIYEYQHYNTLDHNNIKCLFCNPDKNMTLLSETATTFSVLDKYPVSKGHALVIPKRHISNYFDLSIHDQRACWLMVNRIKNILTIKYKPDGYNIGINVNHAGGQTINHIHIHVIPRYINDVENPIGGIRNVIPGKANYLTDIVS